MPITYSLQNLLLDDPDLDPLFDPDDGLLGPIVRMRWISNLVRLAVLEELDEIHAAAGEYTEYDAEICRLRRSSMAPDAGRYYPVEGKANRVFKQLDTEQARQIVAHWRARQTLGDRFDDQSISPSQLASPERKRGEFFEPFGADDQYSQSEYQDEDEFDRRNFEESDEWSDEEYAEDGMDDDEFAHDPEEPARDGHKSFPVSKGPQPQTPPALRPLTAVPAVSEAEPSEVWWSAAEGSTVVRKHQTQPALPVLSIAEGSAVEGNTKHELRPTRVTRFAGAAAVAVLAALLILAATWFLKFRIQTTAPQPAPAFIVSTAKIVPSAVPRHPFQISVLRYPLRSQLPFRPFRRSRPNKTAAPFAHLQLHSRCRSEVPDLPCTSASSR